MRLHFATVPARDPGAAADELNAFLNSHRVVGVEKHLVGETGAAYWAVCVTYLNGTARPSVSAGDPARTRGRVDYRDILDEHDFAVFAELRKLRKEFAEREAVPPYAVFNNEQLAAMVTRRVRTLADVKAIDGVGQARVERYAAAFLERLEQLQQAQTPGNDDAASNPHHDG